MRVLDLRLLPPAIGLWTGAASARAVELPEALPLPVAPSGFGSPDARALSPALTFTSGWGPILAAVLLLGWLAAVVERRRRRGRHLHPPGIGVVATFLVGLLIGSSAVVIDSFTRGTVLADAATDPAPLFLEVRGLARSDPVELSVGASDRRGHRLEVDVRAVCHRGRCRPDRERVLAIAEAGHVRAGQEVSIRGRVRPSQHSYQVAALVLGTRVQVLSEPRGIAALTDRFRVGLRSVTHGLPPQARGLVPGIAIGDDRALPEQLRTDLQTASLTHLTAVSGAHVAIVLALVLFMIPPAGALPAALITVVSLALIVGPMPSILRASVMGAILAWARFRGREAAGLPALGAAIMLIIIVWPQSALSYGFALSVAATAALLLFSPVLARVLGRWMGMQLARTLAIPLSANLACAPILASFTGQVSPYGVLANVLATPAFPPALILAMVTALVAVPAPGLASLAAHASGWFTGWIARVATGVADLPGARLSVGSGAAGVATVGFASVLVLAMVLGLDHRARVRPSVGESPTTSGLGAHRRSRARHRSRSRRSGWAARGAGIAGGVAAVVGFTIWSAAPWRGAPSAPWQMFQCDIGQGSAFLARTGPASAILIDVGNTDSGIDRCLRDAGITHLDRVFLSHPHADHVGGLGDVLDTVDVDAIVIGPGHHPRKNLARIREEAREHGVDLVDALHTGRDLAGTEGWSAWVIVGPTAELARARDTQDGANDLSLIVYVRTATLTALILGDIELEGQDALTGTWHRLCHARACPRVDVLVMAHHGSSRQLPALAEAVNAPVVVVSVGENDYGHPASAALDLYRSTGAHIYRTDRHGHVRFARVEEGISVQTERVP
ncbi:MAG: ComEC/Rec2 family competence protein [Bowdeniella nasicola]|nr:ComEC/Rec2 family competence protein [Bowdeniella nasicola]